MHLFLLHRKPGPVNQRCEQSDQNLLRAQATTRIGDQAELAEVEAQGAQSGSRKAIEVLVELRLLHVAAAGRVPKPIQIDPCSIVLCPCT